MADILVLLDAINNGKFDAQFGRLYGGSENRLDYQRKRYVKAINQFKSLFPKQADVNLFSTPGRTEVGGNHTDHNAGRVLAAAVDLDILAVAAPNSNSIIKVISEGFEPVEIMLSDLEVRECERYTTAALVRGVCARMKKKDLGCGGFDAYVTGTVPKGAGLSSSAAFEVLIATILNQYYNGGAVDELAIANIAQYAENHYFGKPCGLMDQTTCAVGGFVTIDFKNFDSPIVKKVDFDFSRSGYSMVIVDTGGNHADLNEDYAALEHEMKQVARVFGGEVLREFSLQKVIENLSFLRTRVSDRAILRAFHFYYDDQRVADQAEALEAKNLNAFLQMVIDSGESSWTLCQNCYSHSNIEEQGVSIALAVSQRMLKNRGAWRVHGGGFAGTIQAFVPLDLMETYLSSMRAIFGENACHELMVRPDGAIKLV